MLIEKKITFSFTSLSQFINNVIYLVCYTRSACIILFILIVFYILLSDESFDLNANDVQVVEAPISPEQSIHIEMKSSSEDSSNR